MKLEEKLVQLRKEKGLTQLELAESLKVSRQAVSKWESGGAIPSTDNLRSLSELYGVPVDFLFNDSKTEAGGRDPLSQKAESDSPKSSMDRKAAIKYGVIALIILILGIVIGAIWANNHVSVISTKNSGNRRFSGMESDSWENENIEGFSFTW